MLWQMWASLGLSLALAALVSRMCNVFSAQRLNAFQILRSFHGTRYKYNNKVSCMLLARRNSACLELEKDAWILAILVLEMTIISNPTQVSGIEAFGDAGSSVCPGSLHLPTEECDSRNRKISQNTAARNLD